MTGKIKPKEQIFCYHYARLRNAKEAAINAGLSPESGDRLLMRSSITDAIAEISSQKQCDELLQSIVSGLTRLAFSSPNDCIKLILNDPASLAVETLDLFHVSEIRYPKENAFEFKFFDRFKAFDMLIGLLDTHLNKNEANDFYSALKSSAQQLSANTSSDVGDDYET